jgi:MYXO-CTERM domain-containing protein
MMKNLSKPTRALAFLALFSGGAYAASVTVTTSSTFPASAPASTYTAPNGTWALSFQVANPPVVSSSTGGTFTTTYTNGVFTLNGTPITLTGSIVTFGAGGGFTIVLDSVTELIDNSEGTSFFSGTPASPTMVPNVYPNQYEYDFANYPGGSTIFFDALGVSYSVTITATAPPATPLPSSFTMMLIGLAAVALLEMLRRRRATA